LADGFRIKARYFPSEFAGLFQRDSAVEVLGDGPTAREIVPEKVALPARPDDFEAGGARDAPGLWGMMRI
jgi:hypothetical protein